MPRLLSEPTQFKEIEDWARERWDQSRNSKSNIQSNIYLRELTTRKIQANSGNSSTATDPLRNTQCCRKTHVRMQTWQSQKDREIEALLRANYLKKPTEAILLLELIVGIEWILRSQIEHLLLLSDTNPKKQAICPTKEKTFIKVKHFESTQNMQGMAS